MVCQCSRVQVNALMQETYRKYSKQVCFECWMHHVLSENILFHEASNQRVYTNPGGWPDLETNLLPMQQGQKLATKSL